MRQDGHACLECRLEFPVTDRQSSEARHAPVTRRLRTDPIRRAARCDIECHCCLGHIRGVTPKIGSIPSTRIGGVSKPAASQSLSAMRGIGLSGRLRGESAQAQAIPMARRATVAVEGDMEVLESGSAGSVAYSKPATCGGRVRGMWSEYRHAVDPERGSSIQTALRVATSGWARSQFGATIEALSAFRNGSSRHRRRCRRFEGRAARAGSIGLGTRRELLAARAGGCKTIVLRRR